MAGQRPSHPDRSSSAHSSDVSGGGRWARAHLADRASHRSLPLMRTGAPSSVVERGAQQERTLLAWHRTALGLLANVGILVRIAFVEDAWWVLGPAGLAAGTAFLT